MRVLPRPRRPIPFALHRLCRTDPRRVAAVAARYDEGLLPVVPARPPRLRAGKPGLRGLTPFQQQRRARDWRSIAGHLRRAFGRFVGA